MKYVLTDSVHVYKQGGKCIIVNYALNDVFSVGYQESLAALLCFLSKPRSISEIEEKFLEFDRDNIQEFVQRFNELNILKVYCDVSLKKTSCLLLGVGSIGSHIYDQLINIDLEKIVIVDDDTVDMSNINRQSYSQNNSGKKKIECLKERCGKVKNIVSYNEKVISETRLLDIIRCEDINFIIGAADKPSPTFIGNMIQNVSNECNIPYIIAGGYVSSVISMPEFYYPNEEYRYSFNKQSYNYELLFAQLAEKPSFLSLTLNACFLVDMINSYREGKIPFYYKKRGLLDKNTLQWRVIERYA